eukprot:TRINITY_DN7423_c0_g1_i1.p1 TRINITY_DN7423_c0_g1~~TRINITY_DN7423_c0_g1_i1.p1  ORF type:complete len:169 (+),score=68.40 TRINITY_DN7423_c0_g1_i1:55-561(+)
MDPMLQWFQFVDTDRSGQLDYKELQGALKQAGLNFSLMTCNMMLRCFDPDRSGKISFPEFKNLFAWIQQKDQTFMQVDADRSGTLNHGEVYNAIRQAFPFLNLDQHAFYAATKAYDPDNNGHMSRTEYTAFCAYLELASRTFMSFDTARTGTVNLNMSQFIYACSQCK